MAKYYDDYDVKNFYINSLKTKTVTDKFGHNKTVKETTINGKEYVISNLDEEYNTRYACIPYIDERGELTDYVITKCVEIDIYDVPDDIIPLTEICAYASVSYGEVNTMQIMHTIGTFKTFREAEVSCNELNDIIALMKAYNEDDYEKSRKEVRIINFKHQAELNKLNANYRSPEDFSRRK